MPETKTTEPEKIEVTKTDFEALQKSISDLQAEGQEDKQ